MANKSKFQAIRGTRDLLPPDTALWNRVEQTAHEVFTTYGFGEIRPPIIESTELFARSIGVETDVVSKEMYTFEDELEFLRQSFRSVEEAMQNQGRLQRAVQLIAVFSDNLETALIVRAVAGKSEAVEASDELRKLVSESTRRWSAGSIQPDESWRGLLARAEQLMWAIDLGARESLRPEATACVCRAYIEHNMQQLPQPVKLYYMGPMFRRERPQKGRYRQFYQIGAEILGGPDAPAIDAELIEMLMTFFDKCGLQGTELDINSIGHSADNCRRAYVAKLKAELEKVKDQLGADSQRRIETNPLRVLDSKLEHEQPIIEKLPRIADHLCDDCKTHYAAVKRELELRGVIYRENWRLVRGLDYYMRTTFEITARGPRLAKRRLRRRPLRRPRRTPRRPAHQRHRLRHRRRPPHPIAARTRESQSFTHWRNIGVNHRQSDSRWDSHQSVHPGHLHRMDGPKRLRHCDPRRENSARRGLPRRAAARRAKIRQSPRARRASSIRASP